MTDCRKEFPASWFTHAKLAEKHRDKKLNYFGIDASNPLSTWRAKGWIYEGRSARLVSMVLPLLYGPAPCRKRIAARSNAGKGSAVTLRR